MSALSAFRQGGRTARLEEIQKRTARQILLVKVALSTHVGKYMTG